MCNVGLLNVLQHGGCDACLCDSCLPACLPACHTIAALLLQHDFVSADKIVGKQLLPTVGKLAQFLDDELDAAADVMQCCRMGTVSLVSQAMLLIWTCAGAAGLFFLLVLVASLAMHAKKRAVGAFGLPTYGLPTYSGKSGKWSL
jgi:hypothetical protein